MIGNVEGVAAESSGLPRHSDRGDLRWRTFGELLDDAAHRHPGRPAIADVDRTLSFAELRAEAYRVAGGYMALGVDVGDRVAIWAPNGWRWVVSALGAQLCGAAIVPLNTRYRGPEVAHVLIRARPEVLMVANGFLGHDHLGMLDAVAALPDLVPAAVDIGGRPGADPRTVGRSTVMGWESLLGHAVSEERVVHRSEALDGSTVSDVLFTSGTTGRPKGVTTTHAQNLRAYYDFSRLAGFEAGDRYAIVNPFFHAFGYKAGWLSALMHGMTVYPHAVLDAGSLLDQIESERIQVLPGPPTLYATLLADPRRTERDLSSLRVAVTGAASVPATLTRRLYTDLGFERVTTCYGMTEGTAVATISRPDDPLETLIRTSGRALPDIEVAVVDDEGMPVPQGERGEVRVRGYNVMQGYLDDAAETAQRVDDAGWLHSGDIGRMDEQGNLSVTDRKGDMFVVGGFNAYPAEIEAALSEHPGVREVAVVGTPDERMGEVGMAFVIPSRDGRPTQQELVAWARERMANFKVPRHVAIVDQLPRNATGKVLKGDLRAIAAAQKSETGDSDRVAGSR